MLRAANMVDANATISITAEAILLGCKNSLPLSVLGGLDPSINVATWVSGMAKQPIAMISAASARRISLGYRFITLNDTSERLARQNGQIDRAKASVVNDELKKAQYNQIQLRRVQALLDIGNAAAHGNFNEYTTEQVKAALDEIELFLAAHFTNG